jgi:hypothetical protein
LPGAYKFEPSNLTDHCCHTRQRHDP